MMEHHDQTTKREAVLIKNDDVDAQDRAQYRWNTGEISLVSIPSNFFFDPSNTVRPAHYLQSAIVYDKKIG